MIFSSYRLFCSFQSPTFVVKSAFPDSFEWFPQFSSAFFILASCIIFSSKAVELRDSRLPADPSGDSSDTNFCFSFVSWLYRLLFAML